jgi:hypothetical protein
LPGFSAQRTQPIRAACATSINGKAIDPLIGWCLTYFLIMNG